MQKSYPNMKVGNIYKWLRDKRIKINGKKASDSYILRKNDILELYINDTDLVQDNGISFNTNGVGSLDVVYEDDNIVLINKPVGVISQDDDKNDEDTVNNRLIKYLIDKKTWWPGKELSYQPAIVNRLDRNTKGIIIAAKNTSAARILSEKIKSKEVEKYYIAKIHGIIDPKQGVLKDFLTKDSNNNIVKVTKKPISNDSVEIITEYKTISHDKINSFIEIYLRTGKTHQIRAHMNYIGHPLFGEKKYTSINFHDNEKYQNLTSYKVKFNWKTDAGILNYLKGKVFSIDVKTNI